MNGVVYACRSFGNIARNVLRGRRLPFDGSCDRRNNVVHLLNHSRDLADLLDSARRRGLNSGDSGFDVFRSRGGLLGKRLDLGSDHGEAFPGCPGASRFDGDIQGQQVGL